MRSLASLLTLLSLALSASAANFPYITFTGGGTNRLSYSGGAVTWPANVAIGASPLTTARINLGTNLPNSGQVMTLPSQTGISTNLPYIVSRLSSTNDTFGTFNELFQVGYNMAPGPTRYSTNDTAIGYGLEGRYDGGANWTEAHLFFIDNNDIQYRPFSFRINKNNFADVNEMHWGYDYSIANSADTNNPVFFDVTPVNMTWTSTNANANSRALKWTDDGYAVALNRQPGTGDQGTLAFVSGFSAVSLPQATFTSGGGGHTFTTSLAIHKTGEGVAIQTTGGLNKSFFWTTGNWIASDMDVAWADSTDAYSGTKDVGLHRASTGVLKVTNGSSGSGSLNAASILFGTNVLSFTGTNLTWNGTAITVP